MDGADRPNALYRPTSLREITVGQGFSAQLQTAPCARTRILVQAEGYESALKELQTTGKRSHWIWYIFPHLDGLGSSANARFYALGDLAEATAFMTEPVLSARLMTIS